MSAFSVFLDRDGVINEVVWRDGKPASPRSMAELILVADVKSSLVALKAAGGRLFVVTNQPDVARGKLEMNILQDMHTWLMDTLPLDGVSACTHDNHDNCHCRKPKPGMVTDLARVHGLDLSRAWLIGDQARDMDCAQAAGCQSILVSRPYNQGVTANHVVRSLSETVPIIINRFDQFERNLT